MSILQVTPTEVLEHPTFLFEGPHPRLNTVEAARYIAGLSNGGRKHFESLTDKDGKPDTEAQELHMIHDWMVEEDYESLAGHRTSRALQSARHFLTTDTKDIRGGTEMKDFYFPLMEMPRATHIADLYWDQESRFRRGVRVVLAQSAARLWLSATPPDMPVLERGVVPPETDRSYDFRASARLVGHIAMHQEVQTADDQVIGSRYVFTKNFDLARVLTQPVELELGVALGS